MLRRWEQPHWGPSPLAWELHLGFAPCLSCGVGFAKCLTSPVLWAWSPGFPFLLSIAVAGAIRGLAPLTSHQYGGSAPWGGALLLCGGSLKQGNAGFLLL